MSPLKSLLRVVKPVISLRAQDRRKWSALYHSVACAEMVVRALGLPETQ